MAQIEDIYRHLFMQGTITALEGLQLYRCFRLAARIKELRAEGHNIRTIIINDGHKRYAKYILEK